ncbi:MAG: NAD-dependent epimerase/dehydratase family protein, partial [Hyphomicrobium sp.]
MRVLVTGASGFAGAPVIQRLADAGHAVTAGVRQAHERPRAAASTVIMPDLALPFDARPLVTECDAVVHLAGLAHASALIPEATYQAINCEAAYRLAVASRDAGVKRFVFVSSVRAMTGPSAVGIVTEERPASPSDAYGRSKLAAERAVAEGLAGSATDFVILRPVLMFGPGSKGNMAALMRLARTPWPLPLAGFGGRRSLLNVENFADSIAHTLTSPAAAGGTFLVADAGPGLTVGEIVAAMRAGLGKPPRLLHIPLPGAAVALRVVGKADLAARLFGDLTVSGAALSATGWTPPVSTEAGLA